ncbi:GspH/FimT family pseudopilin [Ahniella affigens]|nr:GspH/FimT family pseudopilin [Ahniella affigens]
MIDRLNQRGVTLTELMVALAVLAILAVMAAPGFSDYFHKARMRGAGEALADLLTEARTEAIKRDRQVAVSIVGSGESWCAGARAAENPSQGAMIPPAEPCDCANGNACNIGGNPMRVVSDDFDSVTLASNQQAIVFDGKLGTLTSMTPTRVTLTGPEPRFSLRVEVGPMGLAALCVPAESAPLSGIGQCP